MSANLSTCGINGVATLDCVFPVLATIIYWTLAFAGTAAVILIILAGYRFITSGGDPKKVEQAKKTFSYTIAGLFLIFLSFFIINFIAQTTGVACLDTTKPLSFSSCP